VADFVGRGEVLGLAGVGAHVQEQLDQPAHQGVVANGPLLRRPAEEPQRAGQLAERLGALAQGRQSGLVLLAGVLELLVVNKLVQPAHEVEEDAHRPARVEVVVHGLEEARLGRGDPIGAQHLVDAGARALLEPAVDLLERLADVLDPARRLLEVVRTVVDRATVVRRQQEVPQRERVELLGRAADCL